MSDDTETLKKPSDDASLILRLARDDRDLCAAQRLRYKVFVQEMGGNGPLVDHANRLERDTLDPWFDHLLLIDPRRDAEALDDVVGAYRLLPSDRADMAGGFYSAGEFDLSPLIGSGRKLLELGRSCVHPDHRGGAAMLLLWNGLADYVLERGIEVLFGAASFPGVDPDRHAASLSHLFHNHLAPPHLRVRALVPGRQEMDLLPAQTLDRRAAITGIPALIKAYLRLGGFVGDGAFVDGAFNTTDVCLVMDTAEMSARHRQFYIRKSGRDA
jgi:putative hemolysin